MISWQLMAGAALVLTACALVGFSTYRLAAGRREIGEATADFVASFVVSAVLIYLALNLLFP